MAEQNRAGTPKSPRSCVLVLYWGLERALGGYQTISRKPGMASSEPWPRTWDPPLQAGPSRGFPGAVPELIGASRKPNSGLLAPSVFRMGRFCATRIWVLIFSQCFLKATLRHFGGRLASPDSGFVLEICVIYLFMEWLGHLAVLKAPLVPSLPSWDYIGCWGLNGGWGCQLRARPVPSLLCSLAF